MRLCRPIGLATSPLSSLVQVSLAVASMLFRLFSGSASMPAASLIACCGLPSSGRFAWPPFLQLGALKSEDMQSVASLSYAELIQLPQRQWNATKSIWRGKEIVRWSAGKRQLHVRGSHQYYVTDNPPHCHWQDITVKCRSGKRCLNFTLKSHHLHINSSPKHIYHTKAVFSC